METQYPPRGLPKSQRVNFSSATVRNIMVDLENQGLIYSPHTSAGRVPTIQGYRYFVNRHFAHRIYARHGFKAHSNRIKS